MVEDICNGKNTLGFLPRKTFNSILDKSITNKGRNFKNDVCLQRFQRGVSNS